MSEYDHEGEVAPSGRSVPRSVFDVAQFSPRKAFAQWQAQLDHLADARLVSEPDGFRVRSEAVILDKIVLGHTQNTRYVYDRSRFRIASDSIDNYMLHFFRKGRLICRRTGTGEAIKPGDMVLADLATPESVTITDLDAVHFVVPRFLLAPLLIAPDAHGLRHFSGENVLVKLLHEHVNTLFARSRDITMDQAHALVPPLLHLAAAAINGAAGDETRPGVSSAFIEAIRSHIARHAREPGLGRDTIAAHFGISPRKLSYLFEEDGGVATYIQRERLRLARQALMDATQRGKTVAEIAQAHGFAHRTTFIRAFERVYSVSPGQQRALADKRRAAGVPPLLDTSPIRWIGGF